MKPKVKVQLKKGLGPLGTKLLATLSAERQEVFTMNEAERASGLGGARLWRLLHDLQEGRWIERVERGKYLIIPLEAGVAALHGTHTFIIARKLISPYYIGFHTALNHYGISEQVLGETFIATTRPKRPLIFYNARFHFVALEKKRFFGFSEEWAGELKFNISNVEKTVIDCLFLPKYSGGISEVVKAFKEKLDYGKLYEYAKKMGDLAALKRLGFLLDALEIETPVKAKLLKHAKGGVCLLDTNAPRNGPLNKKWRIIENIPAKELRAEL